MIGVCVRVTRVSQMHGWLIVSHTYRHVVQTALDVNALAGELRAPPRRAHVVSVPGCTHLQIGPCLARLEFGVQARRAILMRPSAGHGHDAGRAERALAPAL